MTDYTKIEKEVDAIEEKIWDVASKIWEFAELGYHDLPTDSGRRSAGDDRRAIC